MRRNLIKVLILTIGIALCSVPAVAQAVDAGAPTTKAPAAKVDDAKKVALEANDLEVPVPPEVPTDAASAMSMAKKLIEQAKAKRWLGFSAGAIWLFMFLFKLGRKNWSLMQKIPKRVLWIVVPLLSVGAMVLAKLQADLSWGAAWVVITSGPSVAFLNDLIKRGVMGKEPSPVNGDGTA